MFVIDVSPSMGEQCEVELAPGYNDKPRSTVMTKLEWSLKYVKYKIQQMVSPFSSIPSRLLMSFKIFTGRKSDKCGVILFGTEGELYCAL